MRLPASRCDHVSPIERGKTAKRHQCPTEQCLRRGTNLLLSFVDSVSTGSNMDWGVERHAPVLGLQPITNRQQYAPSTRSHPALALKSLKQQRHSDAPQCVQFQHPDPQCLVCGLRGSRSYRSNCELAVALLKRSAAGQEALPDTWSSRFRCRGSSKCCIFCPTIRCFENIHV